MEERVERVLSPRLQLEVSCSEVYQYNTQDWRLDVDRMRLKHGGDDGIALYYKQQGLKASCFLYKWVESLIMFRRGVFSSVKGALLIGINRIKNTPENISPFTQPVRGWNAVSLFTFTALCDSYEQEMAGFLHRYTTA